MLTPTEEDKIRKAQIEIILALSDAIRELGSVPSGHLYAQLMGHMSLDAYTAIIDILIRAKRIRREPSHLLVWIG